MLEKNITETVNVNGELGINGDKWIIEKIMSNPHTITESRGEQREEQRSKGKEIITLGVGVELPWNALEPRPWTLE